MNNPLKIFFVIVFWLMFFRSAKAQQNLVPNWSFENISICPTNCIGATTSTLAIGWQNPNNASSDLFNICDTQICGGGWNIPCHGVPSNCWGWQNPRTGLSYSGFAVYGKSISQPNLREYIEIKLSDTLRKNKNYCMSFYSSLADSFSGYATSRMGCNISQGSVTNYAQYLIPAIPQIQNPFNNYLNDKINWTEIKGLYNANGGENYITIGNFFDDSNTDTLPLPRSNLSPAAYFYIDDVSLAEYNPAYAGKDTNVCFGTMVKPNLISTFGAQYNWSIFAGDANSLDSFNVASPTFSPTVSTTYVLQKQQCGILTYDTLIIRVPILYKASVGNDTLICIGDTVKLSAVNNCTWCNHWWNTGLQAQQINVNPVTATSYTFFQKDSCYTTIDIIKVNVEYCNSPIITVPNIFTPNSDEINDVWLPQIQNEISLSDYSVTIYDRWGLKIFESGNFAEEWDGHTTSGTECNEGTYYYIITYANLKTGQKNSFKGFLQLNR
ncbi:MAG TPA: gliding motility-associated C-terminal domain-containing protein [Bacteroidia bacterium]|nr:gliding motility-associated C-terminal domain-containing protein [Bacteroidia bacterium]